MRAREFVYETLNQPYPINWQGNDAQALISRGEYLNIVFSKGMQGQYFLDFDVNGRKLVTGRGDAYRIFATVLAAIKEFVEKQDVKELQFNAKNDEEEGTGRTNLYDRLVKRYATSAGYNVTTKESGTYKTYKLLRKDLDLEGEDRWFREDVAQMTDLDPWTFDQTDAGWRGLPSSARQADALNQYIDRYVKNGQFVDAPQGAKTMSPTILYWHLGQVLTQMGRDVMAARVMRQAIDDSDPNWNAYVMATISFLRKDRKDFDHWAPLARGNEETIKRLTNGWGRPYKQVYEGKQGVAEARSSGYKEIEFICVNPEYPDATDPKLQKQMYLGLKKIPNVIPLLQDWDDYSEGQKSLSAIYKDKESRQKILALAKQLGVEIDLERPVSDDYIDRAIRGEHEGQQGLAEGSADGKQFRVTKQKNGFTVDLYVDGKHAGQYTHTRNEDDVRNFAEIFPEFRNKGHGGMLLLKAIDTADKLGMDFEEDSHSLTPAMSRLYDTLDSEGMIYGGGGAWAISPTGEDALDEYLNENFADGKVKGKSRPGRVKRSGASCSGSVSSLRAKAKKYSGERGKMYHWCANMKSGRNKK